MSSLGLPATICLLGLWLQALAGGGSHPGGTPRTAAAVRGALLAALVLALGSPAAVNAQRSRGAGGGDDGGRSGGGDRGVAVPRGGDAGPRGGDSGQRGGDGGPRSGGAVSRGDSGPRGGDQGGGRISAGGTSSTADTQGTTGDRAVPRRPREDRTAVGRAVPRADVRPDGRNVIIASGRYYGGYYPWGYGGLGLGGYYGFYDPWWDPFYYGGGYYPLNVKGEERIVAATTSDFEAQVKPVLGAQQMIDLQRTSRRKEA